jgi:hypothetical protein
MPLAAVQVRFEKKRSLVCLINKISLKKGCFTPKKTRSKGIMSVTSLDWLRLGLELLSYKK